MTDAELLSQSPGDNHKKDGERLTQIPSRQTGLKSVPVSSNAEDAEREIRANFRHYLELGLTPIWEKLGFDDKESTEKLYDAIVEANMVDVKARDTAQRQAVVEARIDELGRVEGLPQCFVERNDMIVHIPIDKRLGELRTELAALQQLKAPKEK